MRQTKISDYFIIGVIAFIAPTVIIIGVAVVVVTILINIFK